MESTRCQDMVNQHQNPVWWHGNMIHMMQHVSLDHFLDLLAVVLQIFAQHRQPIWSWRSRTMSRRLLCQWVSRCWWPRDLKVSGRGCTQETLSSWIWSHWVKISSKRSSRNSCNRTSSSSTLWHSAKPERIKKISSDPISLLTWRRFRAFWPTNLLRLLHLLLRLPRRIMRSWRPSSFA